MVYPEPGLVTVTLVIEPVALVITKPASINKCMCAVVVDEPAAAVPPPPGALNFTVVFTWESL